MTAPVDEPTEPGGALVDQEMERRNVPPLSDSFEFCERDEILRGLFGLTRRQMTKYWREVEGVSSTSKK